MQVEAGMKAVLDPGFVPAVLWNRAYRVCVERSGVARDLDLALVRPDGTCYRHQLRVLPDSNETRALTRMYLERMLKFLLWQKGGSRILVAGDAVYAELLAGIYRTAGERAFDVGMFGGRIFPGAFSVEHVAASALPDAQESVSVLGGHLEGCRIGFDLGGSDRKCAAVVDGKVVFSEEIAWNPYFESDPQYHLDGIRDSLRRAAAHLPRVDAIGGSAAGVYVNNEVRIASLFRGVSTADFEKRVRRMFVDLRTEWGGIPFDVVNDGEVTALAGAMSLKDGALLGVSMGTSEAAGYCTPEGGITSWLNELAFAPVDYGRDAPCDEWSGDLGCGVQYFSQQAIGRYAVEAGFSFDADVGLAERLVHVQDRMQAEDPAARSIFETVGTCFGYTLAHYAEFYVLRHVLMLGRVTSGVGGDIILEQARSVLRSSFPALAERIDISMPDEKMKRHGQAVAAASLPRLG